MFLGMIFFYIMIIIAVLLYLIILGADKLKTEEDRLNDIEEQEEILEHEKNNKEKRNLFSRFRRNNR